MSDHVTWTGMCDRCQEWGATWTSTPHNRTTTCPTCDKPPTPLTWLRRAA